MEQEQEQKWIRAIVKRGSPKAADALVRAYYDEIYKFVYWQTGNREDALDVTQECFISALRSLSSFDPKKSGFRTWLHRVASHKVIDLRRKRGAAPVFVEIGEADAAGAADSTDFTEQIQNRELLERVEQFVSGMNPNMQEVFRLRIYAGCSFPEIAAVMAEPEAAVKARYYRLAAVVRKEVGDER